LAHFSEFGHPPGEIDLPRSEGVISHEVVGLKEELRLQGGKFFILFGEGIYVVAGGIEKVPGVHHNYILSVFAQIFQEGSPPGQTAKLSPSSTAGFVLPIEIRAEHQGDDLLRLHLWRLPPGGKRNQAKGKNHQIFLHPYLRKTGFINLFYYVYPGPQSSL
jgi:hypothetical protein